MSIYYIRAQVQSVLIRNDSYLGNNYKILDIGMRMLQPHELYAAQGFPSNYIIDHDFYGKPYPKTEQVARCGNAVPPPFAEQLVRENLPEMNVAEGDNKFKRAAVM
ncbi:hypothetical protein II1_05458 [Bacillus cereus MC118]|uniref:Uncharacterized protein n=1 Tax=Bacillus cereus MC67 TaxID=1053219 RepID=J8FW12_BACCE|nr:hypothetical protein II3_00145 [Bacillus cereus MC67]EOO99025.1 hypothetical protein II1_05458 [Bacillus cereus MC118]